MKKATIYRFGLYSAILTLALSIIQFFILIPALGFANAEISGYLTIIIPMIFVFFGIRHYRDKVNNGTLRFGEGLKIGMLIILIPAILFSLFGLLYTEVINPTCMDEYYNLQVANLRASAPPDKLEGKLAELERSKEMFDSPVMQFVVMALTVFLIGFIVTIISSLTLARKASRA